jgi:hypothetical protein
MNNKNKIKQINNKLKNKKSNNIGYKSAGILPLSYYNGEYYCMLMIQNRDEGKVLNFVGGKKSGNDPDSQSTATRTFCQYSSIVNNNSISKLYYTLRHPDKNIRLIKNKNGYVLYLLDNFFNVDTQLPDKRSCWIRLSDLDNLYKNENYQVTVNCMNLSSLNTEEPENNNTSINLKTYSFVNKMIENNQIFQSLIRSYIFQNNLIE